MLQLSKSIPDTLRLRYLQVLVMLVLAMGMLTHAPVTAQMVHTYSNATPMVNDYAYGMEPTPDGGFILAGTTDLTSFGWAVPYLVKTDQFGAEVWSRQFFRVTPADDSSGFRDVDLTYDAQGNHDGYIVTGFISQLGQGDLDIMVMRLDLNGGTVWMNFYQGPWFNDGRRYDDEGYSVRTCADGSFAITGYANGDTVVCDYFPQVPSVVSYHRSDLFLLRIDATGNLLSWASTNDYPPGYQFLMPHFRNTLGNSVHQTSDGGFITVGHRKTSFLFGANENPCTVPGASNFRTFLAKFDANGQYSWSRILPDPGATDDMGYDVRETSDGGLIIAGISTRPSGSRIYVIKTDQWGQTFGSGTWSRLYSRVGANSTDWGFSIRELNSGGYLLGGASAQLSNFDLSVLRIDANGSLMWGQLYGGGQGEWAYSARLFDNHNSWAAAGMTSSFGPGDNDMFLVSGAVDCGKCGLDVPFEEINPKTVSGVLLTEQDHLMQANHVLSPLPINTEDSEFCESPECDPSTQPTFQVTRARFERERGQEGMQTSDGGFIITGFDLKGQTGSLAMLIKTDNMGSNAFHWGYHYKPVDMYTYGYSVQALIGGTAGYAFAGDVDHSFGSSVTSEFNMMLVKVDNAGGVLWGRSYGLLTNDNVSHDHGRSLGLTSDGGYVLAGYSKSAFDSDPGFPGGYNFYVVKTDNAGDITPSSATRWGYIYGSSYDDYAQSVQQTQDGGYIVAGYTTGGGNGGEEICVLKLDSDGSLDWGKRIGTSDDERAYSIQQNGDGSYILSGYQNRGSGNEALVVKLQSDGDLQWSRRYTVTGSSDDRAMSIKATPGASNGGYVIGGWTETATEGKQGYMLKIDDCGRLEWSNAAPDVPTGGPGTEGEEDHFESVALVDDGGYYFVGSTCSFDPHTIKGNLWDVKTRCDGSVCDDEDITTETEIPNLKASNYTPLRFEAEEQTAITVVKESGAGTYYICQEQAAAKDGHPGLPTQTLTPENQKSAVQLMIEPNPVAEQTRITYHIPIAGKVRLEIRDLQGRSVALLLNQYVTPGTHSLDFEAGQLAAGHYICRLVSAEGVVHQSLVLTP